MQGKIALEEHFAVEGSFYNMDHYSAPGLAEDLTRRLGDIEDLRLAEMDRHGIELAVQSLNSPGVQGVSDIDQAIDLAVRSNNALAEQVEKRPGRFAGLAALPMQNPDQAIKELYRCIVDLGFKGAMVNGFTAKDGEPDGVYFDREVYLPFWEASEKLDVPIYMHPRNPLPQHSRAYEDNPWLKGSPWAFAAETSIHALRLMTSGVFDAFPRAQLIIGHLGEHIPYDIWRIDHRLEKSPQGIPAKKSIREYMTENVHLTTAGKFYDPALHFAMGEVGVERIMFSADYPYETMSDAVNWFDNADLSEEDRLKIGRTNAIELLKLDLKCA